MARGLRGHYKRKRVGNNTSRLVKCASRKCDEFIDTDNKPMRKRFVPERKEKPEDEKTTAERKKLKREPRREIYCSSCVRRKKPPRCAHSTTLANGKVVWCTKGGLGTIPGRPNVEVKYTNEDGEEITRILKQKFCVEHGYTPSAPKVCKGKNNRPGFDGQPVYDRCDNPPVYRGSLCVECAGQALKCIAPNCGSTRAHKTTTPPHTYCSYHYKVYCHKEARCHHEGCYNLKSQGNGMLCKKHSIACGQYYCIKCNENRRRKSDNFCAKCAKASALIAA